MDTIWSLLSGILVITIVYMLVRPGSPAAQAVADVTSALTNLIKTATAGPPTTPNTA
jgi:hypothetical protein